MSHPVTGAWPSDDGPTPDPAVLRELHEIDPTIYPVWRNWYMNQIDGTPLLRENGERVHLPQWYIVKACRDGVHRVLFTTEFLDYRIPHKIRTDVGRFMRAEEINRMLDEQNERESIQKADERAQDISDFTTANKAKIREAMESDSNLKAPARRRDAKIASYAGQTNRTSGRDSILPSSKEAGWEMPRSMENEDG